MGKSYTPKYRVEYRDNDTHSAGDSATIWDNVPRKTKVMAWSVKDYGAPTPENLETWRVGWNDSFKRGGVNYHVSLAARVLVHISHARIVEQKSGRVVCSVVMPMFEVI